MSPTLRRHISQRTLEVISKTFSALHWPMVDVSKDRGYLRQWQDIFEDESDPDIIVQKLLAAGSGSQSNQKLWLYLMNAAQRLTRKIQPRKYPEVAGMASYILPLQEVFMHSPMDSVILTCPNTMTKAGTHRKELLEEKHGKRPDMLISVINSNTETVLEVGCGEVKGCRQEKHEAAIARDLVRVGLFLKDMADHTEDMLGITNSVHLGFQVIGQAGTYYLMAKCGTMYIMSQACTTMIPDCLDEMDRIFSDYKSWRQIEAAIKRGYEPILVAMTNGQTSIRKPHFPTTTSPELKNIKGKY
ncbi:hypothetical protein BGZ80_005214 [Entomortierella chlamydospora]|uniref:Uncharacterized protein n=1 Tax=Entomortierella chlamydospora TaxID=101097 RepID=A0A9P6SV20_9FUNG|nr:hypothetical protein BGZ80_005214 [Entomortierella chlamydospora]